MGRIAASDQLGAWEHNCPAVEHYCIEALPGEDFELVVEAVEPGFAVAAVGLELGPHLPEV